jgi:glycosyltransferase involved in cell wall biosynthesis
VISQPHVALLYPRSGNPADAIDHYCNELTAAFTEIGWCAHRSAWLDEDAAVADLLALQYNPFVYGRWGFAPGLPVTLMRLRRRRRRPVVALVVHETFVPIVDARSLAMGAWQRAQLRAVSAGADVVFHADEARVRRLEGRWPRRPTEHLAVGANVPDRRAHRVATRSTRGWGEHTIVIATLGGTHPSKIHSWIAHALEAVAASGRPTVHADLGADPMEIRVPGIDRFTPGFLEADALAAHLAAADLFLAPYVGGVSGRRGSLMAALRNGLAVVSTVDEYSDRLLASPESGLTLVATHDKAGFVRAARELSEDDATRQLRATAAVALYEERFDWPVIAQRLARIARANPPRTT